MTNISDAKTKFGRDECRDERLLSNSVATWASLRITIVWPITVMELIGPGEGLAKTISLATATPDLP